MTGLYPIVRRFRRPLVVEVPAPAPVTPAPVPAAESASTAAIAATVPEVPTPESPPATALRPPFPRKANLVQRRA